MAGQIELEDIQVIAGNYYPINATEVDTSLATPYFMGYFSENVALNRYGSTRLSFMVGGRSNRKIQGQVIRQDGHRYPGFIISSPHTSSYGKRSCDVMIKQPYNNYHIGDWYLTIEYVGAPPGACVSSRRTVRT